MVARRAFPSWPPELFEQAAAMWRNGCSSDQIAAVIGKTRSAVLGMMDRKGVPQGPKSPATDKRRNPGPRKGVAARPRIQAARKPREAGESERFVLFPVGLGGVAERLPPRKIKMDAIPQAPASLQLPLANLEKRQCRWPTHESAGKHLFCGAGTEDAHVYCPLHERAKMARGLRELRGAQPCG